MPIKSRKPAVTTRAGVAAAVHPTLSATHAKQNTHVSTHDTSRKQSSHTPASLLLPPLASLPTALLCAGVLISHHGQALQGFTVRGHGGRQRRIVTEDHGAISTPKHTTPSASWSLKQPPWHQEVLDPEVSRQAAVWGVCVPVVLNNHRKRLSTANPATCPQQAQLFNSSCETVTHLPKFHARESPQKQDSHQPHCLSLCAGPAGGRLSTMSVQHTLLLQTDKLPAAVTALQQPDCSLQAATERTKP